MARQVASLDGSRSANSENAVSNMAIVGDSSSGRIGLIVDPVGQPSVAAGSVAWSMRRIHDVCRGV